MNTINLILIGFNILLALFLIYITTFIKKRGEINATKKDIDILTEKVESVKFDYLKRIEEYKNDLNIKYELGKTLISSKAEAYQLTTSIKVMIIRNRNKPGTAQDLLEQLSIKIPELLTHLYSQVQLRTKFQEEIKAMEICYNEIVSYIMSCKSAGAKTFTISLVPIEENIDRIQTKLME
jgi:hypothetical protein